MSFTAIALSPSIPHFELLKIYAVAYEATGRTLYRYVASTLRDYLVQQMTAPEGGFYTAQDAEVDGEEGVRRPQGSGTG